MPPEANSVRTLTCPACGGTIALRAAGYTVTLACEYCGTLIDATHPDARIIARYQEVQASLVLPLGTRGVLRGVEWEVIGWMQRSDDWASWDEYLLFNPYAGYRWLIAQNGHWSLGTMLTAAPRRDGGDYHVGDQRFTLFYNGNIARVTRVAGEFYWRVRVGEAVRATDYVRPGFMLSQEQDDRERSWTISELLSGREMRAAFDVPPPPIWLPGATPLAHQPSPFGFRMKRWLPLATLAFLALLLLLAVLGQTGSPQQFALQLRPDGPAVSQTFGPIDLPLARQAVTIRTATPAIDQGWVDIDISLVNRETQESHDAYALNERYSGRDSDGAWTEGSRAQTLKVARLPAGSYDLVVEAQAHRWNSSAPQAWDTASRTYAAPDVQAPVEVSLSVARGARFASNFWLAVLLLLLPPVAMLILHIRFENARLAQKDDGPADANDWLQGMQSP